MSTDQTTPSAEEFQELFSSLQAEIGKVIVGQDEVLKKVLLGFLSGGHILLEGVPGLAKTAVSIDDQIVVAAPLPALVSGDPLP